MDNEKYINVTFKGRFFDAKDGLSKELPIIETTKEELEIARQEVQKVSQDEMCKMAEKNPSIPFENFILNIKDYAMFQFEKENETLNCIIAIDNTILFKYKTNLLGDLTSKVFYNKQNFAETSLLKTTFSKDFNPSRIVMHYCLVVCSIFLATNNNVKFVTTENPTSEIRKAILKELGMDITDLEELEDETQTRQQNKMIKENKQNNVISLGKQRIINLADITTKLTSPTRTNKPCEFSFTRRGHWAYSHKTGKKWWVSETVVNKDKPRKQTRYKLDIDTNNSVDDK